MFERKKRFALLLALLLFWALSGTAAAHATLIKSDPPNGALRGPTLSHVTAWFDLPLQADNSGLHVFNAAGQPVSAGAGQLDASLQVLSTTLTAPLAPGVYVARWDVFSDEGLHTGHETQGQFLFWIAEPGGLLQPGWAPAGLGLLGALASLYILLWHTRAPRGA